MLNSCSLLMCCRLQLRIMEQQLTESQWHALGTDGTPSSQHQHQQTPVKERDVIHRLEGQVDEQRAMRLNDAKQVEAKAAKIKEWVTNKLRDVRRDKKHYLCLSIISPFLLFGN